MKEKLTLQDLIDLLAKKAGLTKKEADAFFREFFSAITDSIFNGEQVRIKDFGTFKLTSVSSRESVDVNTGEKIEIPAHYKLSFIPDKALKLLVNKPFEQFETTLLEDTVSFEAIEESEEPAELQEDEDTGIDEPELVKPIENIVSKKLDVEIKREIEDIASRIDKLDIPKDKESDAVAKGDKITKLTSSVQPSFIYTYTTDPVKADEEDNSITIVVPNDKIIVDQPSDINIDKRDERETDSVEFSPVIKEEEVPSGSNTNIIEEDLESGEEVPLNINKVQEKIDQLKEAIDALAKVTWQSESPENSLSTKPSVDEADIYNNQEELQYQSATPHFENVDPSVEKISWDTPDETPFVKDEVEDKDQFYTKTDEYEDITDEISRGRRDEDLLNSLVDAEKESQNVSLNELDNKTSQPDVDPDDDLDYYNEYKHDTIWTKLRKRLPIIIFLLAVIGFGGYHFFKLFEQKYDYQNYSPYRSLSDVDTLPNVRDTQNESILAPGDDANIVPEDIDFENPQTDESTGNSTLFNDNLGDTALMEQDSAQTTVGKIISDNLHIKVLRKASYMKEKGAAEPAVAQVTAVATNAAPPVKETRETTNKPELKLPANEVVKQGATLKIIARKYYGSGDFWVYIYEENKAKLRSFDALSIGQTLTIPSLKKYNTSADDPQALKKAKELEGKIYSSAGRY